MFKISYPIRNVKRMYFFLSFEDLKTYIWYDILYTHIYIHIHIYIYIYIYIVCVCVCVRVCVCVCACVCVCVCVCGYTHVYKWSLFSEFLRFCWLIAQVFLQWNNSKIWEIKKALVKRAIIIIIHKMLSD